MAISTTISHATLAFIATER